MRPHATHMRRALDLALRGAGFVSPNPLVGCVLVGETGEVIGEGWHERYGSAHAEVNAVRDAEQRLGDAAAGALARATAYVTLEPCSHFGKTPPCADLLVQKRIPRVVVAMQDPFPEVAGRGIERLREAGVGVVVGVEEDAARALNAAFLHHVATGKPLVTLKIAQTLDGRIAARTGHSRWVSGPEARARVHAWRAQMDGVLVGSGTALADDPALTVRDLPGWDKGEGKKGSRDERESFEAGHGHLTRRQPTRVVLDRAGRLPPTLRLFTDAFAGRTVAVVAEGARPSYAEALENAGGRILRIPVVESERGEHLDLAALLDALGAAGQHGALRAEYGGAELGERAMQSLLVEAGPGLATALVQQKLADRLALFVAPKILGEGIPSFGDLGAERMTEALPLEDAAYERVGADLLVMARFG